MLFAPRIFTEYEILFIQFCSTKYKWRSCTALCFIALLLSEYEGKHLLFSLLSTDLLQTYCCVAMQFCKISATLIIFGLIDIINRRYTKPRLPNTTATFLLIYYSILGLNKTKGEFCQLSLSQFITVLATQTLSILVLPSPLGKSQEDKVQLTKISFLLNLLSQGKVIRSVQSPWSILLSKQTSWQLLGFGCIVCYSTLKKVLLRNLQYLWENVPDGQRVSLTKPVCHFFHSGLPYTSNRTKNMGSQALDKLDK